MLPGLEMIARHIDLGARPWLGVICAGQLLLLKQGIKINYGIVVSGAKGKPAENLRSFTYALTTSVTISLVSGRQELRQAICLALLQC
jgi:hypothetical protein